MKTILVSLMLLLAVFAFGQEITPGGNPLPQDGQRLTAQTLINLVAQAQINPSFYTSQVQHNTNLLTTDIILLVTSGGVYQQMPGSGIINNPLSFTVPPNLTTIPPYATLLYYNVSNNTITSITYSNLALAVSSNINVASLVFTATNAGSTNILVPILLPYTNTPNPLSTNDQNQFLTWDTNGLPFSLSFSNFLVAAVPYLGTNLSNSIGLPRYIFTNLFAPWTFYPTNVTTNAWGYATNFPITNLFFTNAIVPTNNPTTNNLQTLTNSDQIPVLAASQSSSNSTTFTLEALFEYLTNRNTLPAYAVARVQFNGVPLTCNITNVNTTSNFFFATNNGLTALQAVSFQFSSTAGTTLPTTPQIVSNMVYYAVPVGNGSNFMLFTNYANAQNLVNPIVPTGTASVTPGVNVMLYLTNYTAFNADAIQLCTASAVKTGFYDMCFRTSVSTPRYYVTGLAQDAANDANFPNIAVANNPSAFYTTNRLSVFTAEAGVGPLQPPRVSILVQPE